MLMKKVFPSWSGKDALRALHAAFLEENAEADEELDIEEDMLQEVVAPSDVKDVRKSCADLKTARARKEAAALKRPDTVARYFTCNAPPKSRKQSAKPAPRWLPGRNPKAADATYFIQKHAPPHSHVWGDEYNGRWKFAYIGRKPQSISWTKRGLQVAAGQVLHTLHRWHYEATNESPPYDIELAAAPA